MDYEIVTITAINNLIRKENLIISPKKSIMCYIFFRWLTTT
jgi:hypothetical protein